jgi:hypothetical protein
LAHDVIIIMKKSGAIWVVVPCLEAYRKGEKVIVVESEGVSAYAPHKAMT